MMEGDISEYNQRQYLLMIDRLNKFRSNKLDILTLINDLSGLVDALESPDEAWKQGFISEWGQLEVLYASALDRVEEGDAPDVDTIITTPENKLYLARTLDNLQRLIAAVYTV